MKDRTGYKKCGSCRSYKEEDLFNSKFGLILKTCEPCRTSGTCNYIKIDRSNEIKCARCRCYRTAETYKDDTRSFKSCLKCRVVSRTHMAKKKQKI